MKGFWILGRAGQGKAGQPDGAERGVRFSLGKRLPYFEIDPYRHAGIVT
jgi:hypothetical protein